VSVRLMGAVFELEISASEKLVLLAMADHARDDGTGCYPSVETLARKTSQTRRGVQKIMRKLEVNRGLIEPSKVSRGRRTTEYRIVLGNREQGSLLIGGNREPGSSQPRTGKRPTANQETRNREHGSPKPLRTVLEPSEEPRPQKARPASPPFGNLSKPQKRYGEVRDLIGCGEEILRRVEGRPLSLADLHEDLKCLAAARGLTYDSAMVVTAADIALRRESGDGSFFPSGARR
jgi:hypothetical protein